MGSIMMHYFLQQQTLAWKEKHIRCEEKKHIRCLKRLGKLQVEDNNSIYNDPHRSFLSVMSVTTELQYTSWWDGSGMKFEMGGMDPTWKKTIIFKQDVISEIFLVFLKTYFGHQKKSRIWPKNSEDVWEFFPSQYHYYCIPCPGSISSKTFVCYRCSWQDGWGWGWRRYFFI